MGWLRAVQVFGGISIAVGLLSMCNNVGELMVGVVGPDKRMATGEGLPAMMKESSEAQYRAFQHRGYRGYLAVQGGLDSLLAIGLVVGGIGLLRLRPWGRRLAMGWGFYQLASSALYVVMLNRYMMPEVLAASSQPAPAGAGVIVSVLLLLVLWLYPAALLTLLMLPRVKAGLRKPSGAAAAHGLGVVSQAPLTRGGPPIDHEPPPTPDTRDAPAPPPPEPPPGAQTWRDDPWNDPDAT